MIPLIEIIQNFLVELGCHILDKPLLHNGMWVFGIEIDHQPQSRIFMVWVQDIRHKVLFMSTNGGSGRMKELLPQNALYLSVDLANPDSIEIIKDFVTKKAIQEAEAIVPEMQLPPNTYIGNGTTITWTTNHTNCIT